MVVRKNILPKDNCEQSGAALAIVIMITFLLLTASAAMLTAVGANSRNTTDVLAETKAYYAAESGLQATINVLRYTKVSGASITYTQAALDPDMSTWLPYNYPVGAPTRVVIGQTAGTYDPNTGTAYSVLVTDPDNSASSTTFMSTITDGFIAPATGSVYLAERPFTTGGNTTKISFAGLTSTITHPDASEKVCDFVLTNLTASGAMATIPIASAVRFSFIYKMTLPRPASVAIAGSISIVSGVAIAKFDAPTYKLLGSTLTINGLNGSRELTLNPATSNNTAVPTPITFTITPAAPSRLKVLSTGYGPNGSTKKLEGIIQQNLFDGLSSGAGTSMIGAACPAGDVCFDPGSSNGVTYDGCARDSNGIIITCVPSFGATNQTTLDYIIAHPPGGSASQMTPPPAILQSPLPPWQSSPAELDKVIDKLRTVAQNSGKYYVSPNQQITDPGDYATGTGITFCEGSCTVKGDGGGTLVVTGQLTNVGGFNFKGMIIVTGEEGWDSNGGGSGVVKGSIVIAPYNRKTYVPENLSSTFLPPRYTINGGGSSDVAFDDLSASFDNTSGVSDFMAGVAEK